jgi:hypothetical protein
MLAPVLDLADEPDLAAVHVRDGHREPRLADRETPALDEKD